ncbi:MAG: DUF86 domain-containing protein [Parcubacteria group bacterium]|nr:DUF86 domain-containing protein [Parcubacteria group bacterium]
MKKDPKILLLDVLDSIESIEEYTKNISKNKFFDTPQTQDAVFRRIEIIGEAVKGLPISFRNKHPDIPWKKIAGTRDTLIHDYSGVDIDLVWGIVKTSVPILKKQISELLKNLEQ